MPTSSTSLATHRPDLQASFMEFDLEMQKRGFIALRVLPAMDVATAANIFGKIPIEQLLANPETRRAPGSRYTRGKWKFENDAYVCQENGYEEPVDDREAKMYANFFTAEQVATARAFEAVLSSMERRVADLVFNTTTYTPTAVGTEWSNYANATPIDDVEARVQAVRAASGLWCNSLVITKTVFRNLRLCQQIKDAVAASGAGDPNNQRSINEAVLAQVFDLDNIIVAGSIENTANEGATPAFGEIWDDEYAMVCKTATGDDIREPCLGRTFHFTEDGSDVQGMVETYRDEPARSDVVRVRNDTHEKLIHETAGALLSNITA